MSDATRPVTAEDRADMDVVIAAVERGFRIAVQCRSCGRWLVERKSVRHRLGPTCRARAGRGGAAA